MSLGRGHAYVRRIDASFAGTNGVRNSFEVGLFEHDVTPSLLFSDGCSGLLSFALHLRDTSNPLLYLFMSS